MERGRGKRETQIVRLAENERNIPTLDKRCLGSGVERRGSQIDLFFGEGEMKGRRLT
jgi:hypothetical protein